MTTRNVKFEANNALTTTPGVITLYDCPSNSTGTQFFFNSDSLWMTGTSSLVSAAMAAVPPNDKAVALHVANGLFLGGFGETPANRWAGLPAIARQDMSGQSGILTDFDYAPPYTSSVLDPTSSPTPLQFLGDVELGQLYQYTQPVSDFLYAATDYSTLPNGTTLYQGQILAPPSEWYGANGKRYAIDDVYQTGTTGTPNGGSTTCTGTTGQNYFTCTSATDLSAGQIITVGTNTKVIDSVDASNPSAVQVNLLSNLTSTYSTATALSFSAPVLGSEIQLPTKCSAAPTTGTWIVGDVCWNSAATSGGTCYWENVAAGTPGTWTAVPCSGGGGGGSSPAGVNGQVQTRASSSTL
jgi:hypothetical protein